MATHLRQKPELPFKLFGLIVVTLMVAAMSVATVGVPATLLVAGVWSYSAIFGRYFQEFAGPVSWAAGILIETTFLAAESFITALVSPHSHPQFVYVAFLVVPLLGALALFLKLASSSSRHGELVVDRVSGEPWLALVVMVFVDGMFEVIKLHGQNLGIAWAMSGDARNHVIINDGILLTGGLTLKGLKAYPEMVNALTAILAGAGGRANLGAGTLMSRDVQAMAAMIILSCVAIGCLFIAAIAETLPKVIGRVRRISFGFYIPLIGCATLTVGAYVLGLTESGGFLTAIGSLAIALASIVIGLRFIRKPNALMLVLLTFALFLTVTSWTILAVIPATLLVVGSGYFISTWHRSKDCIDSRGLLINWLATAFAVFSLVAIIAELYISRVSLMIRLKGYGGIVPPNPGITLWVGVSCVVVLAIAPNRQQRQLRLVMLCVYVSGCAAALWLRNIEPPGLPWSYYSAKMLWLATACTIWIPFIMVTDAVQWIDRWRRLGRARFIISVPVSVATISGLLWFSTVETPVLTPFTTSFVGDTYPTPSEVSLVFKEANIGGPFVFFNYSQSLPAQWANNANDQLGDFWSALAWDLRPDGVPLSWPGLPNSFYEWAYGENGSVSALCKVLNTQTIRIVTSDPKLGSELNKSCPAYRDHSKADVIDIEPALKTYTNPL